MLLELSDEEFRERRLGRPNLPVNLGEHYLMGLGCLPMAQSIVHAIVPVLRARDRALRTEALKHMVKFPTAQILRLVF